METTNTMFVAWYFSFGEYKYGIGDSANNALLDMGKPHISTTITVDQYDDNYNIHNGHTAFEGDEFDGVEINPIYSYKYMFNRNEESDWDDILAIA